MVRYAGAAVSGVDQIPGDRPIDVRDPIKHLAVCRKNGIAIISVAIDGKLSPGSAQIPSRPRPGQEFGNMTCVRSLR